MFLGNFFFKNLYTMTTNILYEVERKQLSLYLWVEYGNGSSKGGGRSNADIHEFAIVMEVYCQTHNYVI